MKMSNPSTEALDCDEHWLTVENGDLYFGISLSIFYGLVLLLLCLYPCCKHASKPDSFPHPDNKDYVGVKTAYLIAVIHYLDTITDQLLLLEWYYFQEYFDNNGISFSSMIATSVFWIFIYRVLTGLYFYKYYNNKWYFAAQILNVGIGLEVRESHMRYDVTDNLQYLSKLEQTFETLPLVLIQVYVFLRILPLNLKYLPPTTYWSMATSFLSLLSKLIINDAALFLEDDAVDRRKIIFWRLLFRIRELLAPLLIVTLVGAYLRIFFVFFWLLIELSSNLILYDKVKSSFFCFCVCVLFCFANSQYFVLFCFVVSIFILLQGLLGARTLNFVSYIASVDNLGMAPQRGHRSISQAYWDKHPTLRKLYDGGYWVVLRMEFYLIPFKQKLIPSALHYLGYIYIRGKTIQGLLLASLLITMMVVDNFDGKAFKCVLFEGSNSICTSLDYGNKLRLSDNAYIAIIMLIISLVCFIIYQATFRLYLFKYLCLAFVLSRDPWVLIRNGKWDDCLRALRGAGGKQTRLDMIDIFKKIIDDRIDLPPISYKQHKYGLDLPVAVAVVSRNTTLLSDASSAHLNVNPDAGGDGGSSIRCLNPGGNKNSGDTIGVSVEIGTGGGPQPDIARGPSLAWNKANMKREELSDQTRKETAVIVSEVNRYWIQTRTTKPSSVHVSTVQRRSTDPSADNVNGRVVHRGGDAANALLVPAHQDHDTMEFEEDEHEQVGGDDLDNEHFLFDLLFYALENDHTSFIEFFLNSFVFQRIHDYKPLDWQENVSARNEILQRLIFYLNPLAKRRDESSGKYPLTLLFCLQIGSLFNYIIDMSLVKFFAVFYFVFVFCFFCCI